MQFRSCCKWGPSEMDSLILTAILVSMIVFLVVVELYNS